MYFGVLSAHSQWRSQVVPRPKEEPETEAVPEGELPNPASVEAEPVQGAVSSNRYIPWHELLRRTFGSEVVCPDCGGKLRLLALVKSETTIRTLLAAMHLPTGPPKVASLGPVAVEVEDLDWSGGGKDQDWLD